MRKEHLIGWLLFWAISWRAQGQEFPSLPLPSLDEEESQRWVVKFAPLTLFDPNNTIEFGAERMVGQRQSLQGEFGYGWGGMNLWNNSFSKRYKDVEIWRGRLEWRYYLRSNYLNHAGPIGLYIAVEGFYKQLNAYEQGTIGIGCQYYSYGCQYYQLSSIPITKRVWGGHIKFGRQFRLFPDSDHWLMDFYIGLGLRGNTVERGTKPTGFDYYEPTGLFDLFSPSDKVLPSMAYGFKIGYSL